MGQESITLGGTSDEVSIVEKGKYTQEYGLSRNYACSKFGKICQLTEILKRTVFFLGFPEFIQPSE
jgi:hypothetical protein